MNDINLPQLEKFSLALKIKLWISVIYDAIGLIFNIALIIALVGFTCWAITQQPFK